MYLDANADPNKIGTVDLYKDPKLWDAIHFMAADQLANYHTEKHPHMTDEQMLFVYDGFFPFVKRLMQGHVYNKEPVVDQMREVFLIVCEFSERVLKDIAKAVRLETLSEFIAACSDAIPGSIPEHVSQHVYEKRVALDAHVASMNPLKQKYVFNCIFGSILMIFCALDRYDAIFAKQVKLNEEFDEFAVKLSKVYKGPNTPIDQLPHRANNHRHDHFCDEKGSGEDVCLSICLFACLSHEA